MASASSATQDALTGERTKLKVRVARLFFACGMRAHHRARPSRALLQLHGNDATIPVAACCPSPSPPSPPPPHSPCAPSLSHPLLLPLLLCRPLCATFTRP
jgi:hypothetical protein